MSRLAPGLIELNKGLDLNTAKIAAPEGTLLDSLNYEQVDFQGQKRIDGYARYDGSKGSYIDDFLRIEGSSGTPGDIVHLNSSGELGAEGKLFGIVVGSSDGSMDVAVIDETLIPKLSAAHTWGTKAADLSPDEHYELILLYNQVLRERTTELPGPVAGLHWFRDRLYAVADVLAIVVGTETEQCLKVFLTDAPYGNPFGDIMLTLPEWYNPDHGQGMVFSNYPSRDDSEQSDYWEVEMYMDYYDEYTGYSEWYYNSKVGNIPWGPWDGSAEVVDGWASLLSDGYREDPSYCATISLRERTPQ